MSQSLILAGANCKLWINGKLYKEVVSLSFSIDYGETEIRGIDSPYAQEIALTNVTVRGSVKGLRIKNSGGIQAKNMRPQFLDMAAAPYVSIRVQDFSSSEDIILIQQAKITRESHTVEAKRTYKLDFDFVGMIPLMALDRI
jgi:hypothetical protein